MDDRSPGLTELRELALRPKLQAARREVAHAVSGGLTQHGRRVQLEGHIFGRGRVDGSSVRGNGDDRLVASGYLLQAAGQLLLGVVGLIDDDRAYAAAALARQLVEVEYLCWAFETNHDDAATWLNSSATDRRGMWQPRHMRARSNGRFPAKDYSSHCEMGGHPTPDGLGVLLGSVSAVAAEMTLADAVSHGLACWSSMTTFADVDIEHRGVDALAARWQAEDQLLAAMDEQTERIATLRSR